MQKSRWRLDSNTNSLENGSGAARRPPAPGMELQLHAGVFPRTHGATGGILAKIKRQGAASHRAMPGSAGFQPANTARRDAAPPSRGQDARAPRWRRPRLCGSAPLRENDYAGDNVANVEMLPVANSSCQFQLPIEWRLCADLSGWGGLRPRKAWERGLPAREHRGQDARAPRWASSPRHGRGDGAASGRGRAPRGPQIGRRSCDRLPMNGVRKPRKQSIGELGDQMHQRADCRKSTTISPMVRPE